MGKFNDDCQDTAAAGAAYCGVLEAGMTSHNTRAMRCLECRSTDLAKSVRSGQITCGQCGNGCTQEEAAKAALRVVVETVKREGSGVIAGRTYRQELAREILAQHERERAVAGPRKPGRGRPVSGKAGT